MARTRDPSRLSHEECRSFRDLVREVRDLKDVTNKTIADHLGWNYDKIVNVLKDDDKRNLSPETAFALLRALAEVKAGPEQRFGADRLLVGFTQTPWVKRYHLSRESVSALIPRGAFEMLADVLAAEIVVEPGISNSKLRKAQITKAIVRALRKNGPRMAMAWYQEAGSYVQRFVRDAASGEFTWEGPLGMDVLKMEPQNIARESIYLAAAGAYPKQEIEREPKPKAILAKGSRR